MSNLHETPDHFDPDGYDPETGDPYDVPDWPLDLEPLPWPDDDGAELPELPELYEQDGAGAWVPSDADRAWWAAETATADRPGWRGRLSDAAAYRLARELAVACAVVADLVAELRAYGPEGGGR